MQREQEPSSTETSKAPGANRHASSVGGSKPGRGRGLISLQRSAGNRAVAKLMSRTGPVVVQRDLEGSLKEKLGIDDADAVADELAGSVQQHKTEGKAGQTWAKVGGSKGGSSKGGSSKGGSPSGGRNAITTPPKKKTSDELAKDAETAYNQYLADLKDPGKMKEKGFKDKLEKAKAEQKKLEDKAKSDATAAEKATADRDKNKALIQKHKYKLKGDESDDDIADLAEMFKGKEKEARKKKMEVIESQMAADQLMSQGQQGFGNLLQEGGTGRKRKL